MNYAMVNDLLDQVIEYANKHYDGHFTLMKFTGNWRACYGTPNDFDEINLMLEGKTQQEVLKKLIDKPLSVYDMDKESLYMTDEEMKQEVEDLEADWNREYIANKDDDEFTHIFDTEKCVLCEKEINKWKEHHVEVVLNLEDNVKKHVALCAKCAIEEERKGYIIP